MKNALIIILLLSCNTSKRIDLAVKKAMDRYRFEQKNTIELGFGDAVVRYDTTTTLSHFLDSLYSCGILTACIFRGTTATMVIDSTTKIVLAEKRK